MSIFVAGLDLGQAKDYTGLVIVEAHGTQRRAQYEGIHELVGLPTTEWKNFELPPVTRLDVRHIERFALGTKYGQICIEMDKRMRAIPMPRYLAIDRTGVGVGISEMMAPLNPIGITITAGADPQMVDPQHFRVPKRDLVSNLQVPLQNGNLRIAKDLPHAGLLRNEMQNFRVKLSSGGHESYEAWREADHDDLVLGAAIAVWTAKLIFDIRLNEAQAWLDQQQIRPYQISPV